MAKTSAIQKNLKRIKLVKKYAKKRAALKKIINDRKLELSERFEAQLKLNKLPKNSAKIRIRNGQMRSLNSVEIPSSNFRKNILEILKNEGYIKDYFIEKTENNKTSLRITLKYYEGDPVIKEIKRISKPGRRVYSRAISIPKVMNGLGLAILSTPKGIMSDSEARKNNIGGEIICRVF